MGRIVAAVMVALVVLTNSANAQTYQCFGGCYNECFLRSTKSAGERLACFYECLPGCIPRTADDYRYYCQIGCSSDICRLIPYNDGARMEECFERCSNLCRGGTV